MAEGHPPPNSQPSRLHRRSQKSPKHPEPEKSKSRDQSEPHKKRSSIVVRDDSSPSKKPKKTHSKGVDEQQESKDPDKVVLKTKDKRKSKARIKPAGKESAVPVATVIPTSDTKKTAKNAAATVKRLSDHRKRRTVTVSTQIMKTMSVYRKFGSLCNSKEASSHIMSANAQQGHHRFAANLPSHLRRTKSLPCFPSWALRVRQTTPTAPLDTLPASITLPSLQLPKIAIQACDSNLDSSSDDEEVRPLTPSSKRVSAFDWFKSFDNKSRTSQPHVLKVPSLDTDSAASYDEETWTLLSDSGLDDSEDKFPPDSPTKSACKRRIFSRSLHSRQSSSNSQPESVTDSSGDEASNVKLRALDEEQTTKKDSSSLSNESKAVKKFQETPHIDTTANASVPATHTDKKKSHRTSIKRNDVKKNITKVDVAPAAEPPTPPVGSTLPVDDDAIFKKPLRPVPRNKKEARRRTEIPMRRKDAAVPLPTFKNKSIVKVRRSSIRIGEQLTLPDEEPQEEQDGLVYINSVVSKSSGTVRKVLSAGKLETLMDLLISQDCDVSFLHDFFMALPFFTTPTAVLKHFSTRFNMPQSPRNSAQILEQTQTRIIEVLQEWILSYFRYFIIDKEYLNQLYQFIDETVKNWVHDKHFGTHELLRRIITYKLAGIDPRDLAALAVKMKHPRSGVKQAISPVRLTSVFVGLDAIKWLMSTWNLSEEESTEVFIQLLKEGFVTSAKSSDPANRFVYKKTRKYSFNIPREVELQKALENSGPIPNPKQTGRFVSFHAPTFAKQLAIFEHNMFKRIEPHELHYWLKGDKAKRAEAAPNLNAVINFINKVSAFVATEIIGTANPKQRLTVLKRFILVAQHCLECKNYQGLLEIIGGLQHTAVGRLSCWKQLPARYIEMFEKLAEVVSPAQNWKFYRPLIDTETPPAVPYIGLFLSDLTFINDGNPTYTDDGMVNWKKVSRITNIFVKIKQFQSVNYNYAVSDDIMRFLREELYTIGSLASIRFTKSSTVDDYQPNTDEKDLFAKSRLLEPARTRSNSVY